MENRHLRIIRAIALSRSRSTMNVRVRILYYFMPDRENSIDRFADSDIRIRSSRRWTSRILRRKKAWEKSAKIGKKVSRGNDRKQAYDSNGSWDVRWACWTQSVVLEEESSRLNRRKATRLTCKDEIRSTWFRDTIAKEIASRNGVLFLRAWFLRTFLRAFYVLRADSASFVVKAGWKLSESIANRTLWKHCSLREEQSIFCQGNWNFDERSFDQQFLFLFDYIDRIDTLVHRCVAINVSNVSC